MTRLTIARVVLIAALAGAVTGCAVVKLPVKAAGTVVGHTILAVTQSPYRPY